LPDAPGGAWRTDSAGKPTAASGNAHADKTAASGGRLQKVFSGSMRKDALVHAVCP